METLYRIAHDEEQTGPIILKKLPEGRHNSCMNSLLIGLPQTHDQDAAMRLVAVRGEALVCRDKYPLLALSKRPQLIIRQALSRCASEIENIMSQRPEFVDRDVGDVFIDENLHGASTTSSSGVTCSSASDAA